jgi:hypothetical protein
LVGGGGDSCSGSGSGGSSSSSSSGSSGCSQQLSDYQFLVKDLSPWSELGKNNFFTKNIPVFN